MLTSGILILFLLYGFSQEPAPQALEKSKCHVFIDESFIWTMEMVGSTPVLNIITLSEGKWEFRPQQIEIYRDSRRRAEIKKFSIDTGVVGDPYDTQFMTVHGNSFIGLDLIGDVSGFEEPSRVAIELGKNRFLLHPIDCLDFETLAEKINQVNFDSPNIQQDFEVLGIVPLGEIERVRAWR